MLHPLEDRLILKKAEAIEKTAGGLLLPANLEQEPMEGTVVAAGPGLLDKNSVRIPPVVKVGDRVLFGKWGIKDVQIDGEEYAVMREADVIGILTEK